MQMSSPTSDSGGDGDSFGSNSNSPIEARREARRKRILLNQEERFKKILGANADTESLINKNKKATFFESSDEPVLPEEFLDFNSLLQADSLRAANSNLNQSEASNLNSSQSESTKAQFINHQLFIIALGALLPFLGLNYFPIYFIAFELVIYFIMGRIPVAPTGPNMIFSLFLVLGLKEKDIGRVKLGIQIFKWLSTDFSFFFTAVLLPQVGRQLFIANSQQII